MLYDPDRPEHAALFNRILDDTDNTEELGFVFYREIWASGAGNGGIVGDCIIDSMSVPMKVGEAMATEFTFTVQGKLRGNF